MSAFQRNLTPREEAEVGLRRAYYLAEFWNEIARQYLEAIKAMEADE